MNRQQTLKQGAACRGRANQGSIRGKLGANSGSVLVSSLVGPGFAFGRGGLCAQGSAGAGRRDARVLDACHAQQSRTRAKMSGEMSGE